MTYPSTSGSRTAAPLTPAAPLLVTPAPTTTPPPSALVGPRPGEPGFIGATTHGESASHRPTASDRRRRKTPLAWLPWALLAALLGLVLLIVLAGTLLGRDSSTSNSGAGTPAAATSGSLTAGGKDLLAGDAGLDALPNLNGTSAVGRNVLVQSVVADEGFWVGRSAADRVFVYLTPQARKTNGESPFQVRAGQHVDLDGSIGILGANGARQLGVTDTEGSRQLTSQKGYVVAKSVRISS